MIAPGSVSVKGAFREAHPPPDSAPDVMEIRDRGVWRSPLGRAVSFRESSTRKEGHRAALLARQAYLFHQRYQGTILDQMDNTLRRVLEPFVSQSQVLNHQNVASSVAFSPDGKFLASGSRENIIRIWDLSQPNTAPRTFAKNEDPIWSVAFSPDGYFLASGSADQTVRIWDLRQPTTAPRVLTGHEAAVLSVTFSPDGYFLASGSADQTVRVWDLRQPTTAPRVLAGHEAAVLSVSFSSNGRFLASSSKDSTVRLWDLNQPTATPRVLTGHEDYVSSVAFSPDGTRLASGSWDKTIRVWNVSNLLHTDSTNITSDILTGHENYVTSVAFSPDGQFLASGGADQMVRVWDLGDSTSTPRIFAEHEDVVTSVIFSPDSMYLASSSNDKTLRIRNIQVSDLAGQICGVVDRNLTWDEWQQFVSPNISYERTCVNLPMHHSVLEVAQNFAKVGRTDEAEAIFQRVLELDQSLKIDPAMETKIWRAQGYLEEGQQLAKKGSIDSAVTSFKNALELNPNLNIDPIIEANKLRTEGEYYAKVSKLLRIAGMNNTGPITVKLELLRFKTLDEQQGTVVPDEVTGKILRDGDIIAFQVKNTSPYPIDISLLYVDSGYGLSAFFPQIEFVEDNRLPPGEILLSPRAKITSRSLGHEYVVMIAVKANKERINFAWLEQPILEQVLEQARGQEQRSIDSPLGRFLVTALYGKGLEDLKLPALDLNDYTLQLLDWRTEPAEK